MSSVFLVRYPVTSSSWVCSSLMSAVVMLGSSIHFSTNSHNTQREWPPFHSSEETKHAHKHTHIYTHTNTHTYTHARTQASTHARTRTHTHTHTHTHTYVRMHADTCKLHDSWYTNVTERRPYIGTGPCNFFGLVPFFSRKDIMIGCAKKGGWLAPYVTRTVTPGAALHY